MKIHVDAREFTEHGRTGISRYLENLLSPLRNNADPAITLLTHDRRHVPASLSNGRIRTIELPTLPTPLVDQLVLPCMAVHADVFFSPYYKIPLTGRFRRILTVHDIMFLRRRDCPAFHRIASELQLRLAVARTDIILVDSDFTGRDLAGLVPAANPKIRLLYPDLDDAWLKPMPDNAVANVTNAYADGRPLLLYVGNFHPHKNVDLLVRAFAGLVRAQTAGDTLLLLAGGDDANAPRVETCVRQCGMAGRVRICRHVPDADLRALYQAARWFVTASAYEGFGFPAVEAMASQCPVVCHPATSLAEIAGTASLPIPELTEHAIADTLRTALTFEDGARRKLVERGLAQAKRFKPGSASKRFLELLGSLSPR